MVALLENAERAEVLARFARPQPLPGGLLPEERLIVGGIGWAGYLALDAALGQDRAGQRLSYLQGDLEIMSTSEEHERVKEWIGDLMGIYFEEANIPVVVRGQATLRLADQAGAEPDKSWCLGETKPFPDIVLEIALTSGGLPKLQIYQQFGVAEVWIWQRGSLEVHCLRPDRSGYDRAEASRLLPRLPIAALNTAIALV